MSVSPVIINDVIPRTQIIASAGQVQFDTDWTADVAANVVVYRTPDGVPPNDVTQKVNSIDYVVTFVGGSQTVRVTFGVGVDLNDVITIVRDTPADRTNLYTNTNFTPTMLNEDFGILTLVDQQAQMYDLKLTPRYNTCFQYSNNSDPLIDLILPRLNSNQIWKMNNANTAIETFTLPNFGSYAPGDAKYLVQTADANLPNAQAMGALASGLVVNTTSTGVQLTRTLTGTSNEITMTNGDGISGNPTVSITPNPTIPGSEYILLPSGTTAQRPGSPSDGMIRYNTDLQALELYEGGSWDSIGAGGLVDTITGTANQIDVDNTDPQNPVLSLSATLDVPGTFTIQNSTDIDEIINDNTMATATATNIPTALSVKEYVNAVATGFIVQEPCYAGTTGDLSGYTYNNGASGVGATLTAGSNGAFSTDGVSPSLNARILVKDQSSSVQNGIYTLTTVGDGSNPSVLTRATDYDAPSEIQVGDLVIITAGDTLASSSWLQTAVVVTIGVSAISFTQFTTSLPISVPNGGTGKTSLTAYAPIFGGTTSAGPVQQTSALTDGQLAIGATGALPVAANITAGTGITITNGAGSIEIAASASAVPAGTIIDFGGTSAPAGYLGCDGSAVSRATYSDLFSAIGTTWGVGDGSSTFNLPDFRRRTAVGSGGSGSATLGNAVGNTGGAETLTLARANMPSGVPTNALGSGNVTANSGSTFNVPGNNTNGYTQGSSTPISLIQPSAVVLKCIKT